MDGPELQGQAMVAAVAALVALVFDSRVDAFFQSDCKRAQISAVGPLVLYLPLSLPGWLWPGTGPSLKMFSKESMSSKVLQVDAISKADAQWGPSGDDFGIGAPVRVL